MDRPNSKLTIDKTKVQLDAAERGSSPASDSSADVNQYMQSVGRILYDIIRDWQKDSNKSAGVTEISPERGNLSERSVT
jgi:hypothetical protein